MSVPTRSGLVLARVGNKFRIAIDGGEVTAVLRGKARRGEGRTGTTWWWWVIG